MKNLYALLFAAAIVAISANYFFDGYKAQLLYGNNLAANPDRAYDRMNKTGVLRCGYALSEPALMRDPETGMLSGIFYDYMNMIGDSLSVDVQWTVELHPEQENKKIFGNSHYDIECSGLYAKSVYTYDVNYSSPLYFQHNDEIDQIQAIGLGLPPYEIRLNQMLSLATQNLINNGQVDRLIEKFDGLSYNIKTPKKNYTQ